MSCPPPIDLTAYGLPSADVLCDPISTSMENALVKPSWKTTSSLRRLSREKVGDPTLCISSHLEFVQKRPLPLLDLRKDRKNGHQIRIVLISGLVILLPASFEPRLPRCQSSGRFHGIWGSVRLRYSVASTDPSIAFTVRLYDLSSRSILLICCEEGSGGLNIREDISAADSGWMILADFLFGLAWSFRLPMGKISMDPTSGIFRHHPEHAFPPLLLLRSTQLHCTSHCLPNEQSSR